ncbi:acyltransferase family protein [Mucilaginibacter sp.]
MKERFTVLDIFRGVFAGFVFLYHLSPFAATFIIKNSFVSNADLLVDFFFILSGFVIAYSYQHLSTWPELKTFYKKRFLRVYPLHLFMFLLYMLIGLMRGGAAHYIHFNTTTSNNNITTIITNLLLINSVKVPGVTSVSWNGPSWSISAEVISYFLFSLVIVSINRVKLTRIKNIIYLLVVLAAAFALYSATGKFELVYTYDYGFLRGIIGFFTGVLCYNTYRAIRDQVLRLPSYLFHLLETVFVSGTIVMIAFGQALKPFSYIYEVQFFTAILIFAFEGGWISRLLKRSVFLHQNGTYSYSIYMTHNLIMSLFNILFIRLFKLPPSAYVYLFVVNYAVIYFVSAWTFKHIEMRFSRSVLPLLRWRKVKPVPQPLDSLPVKQTEAVLKEAALLNKPQSVII